MPDLNPRFEYTRNDFLSEQVDPICERVKFHGSYAGDPDRYDVILSAGQYEEVRGIEDWRWESERYPSLPLVAEKLTKYDNEDIPVRAYCLSKALKRLLELADAPQAMISDLTLLLSGFVPKGAQKYADAQRALIENPGAGITEISKISGLDRSTIHALIKKQVLVRPD